MHKSFPAYDKSPDGGMLAFLRALGFDAQVSRLYLVLVRSGPMTMLQASRAAGIERTRLYRMVDVWLKDGIIEEQLAHKTRLLRAADVDTVRLLVQEHTLKIQSLTQTFDQFALGISALQTQDSLTKVLYYRGRAGVRQMLWNLLRAKGEIVTYVYRNYQEVVGQRFFNRWAGEFRVSGIKNRELRHPDFLKTIDPSRLEYQDLGPGYRWRTVSAKLISITHSMDIYNDVVAMYYWREEEILGMEIYNMPIVHMQRSIFDHFWKLSGRR